MKKLSYSIQIDAHRNKVWDFLWDNEGYKKWTSVFSEGSYAVTDWNEGSKVQFFSGDGKEGMYSVIEKKIPNEYMSFKHLGEIKNGQEMEANEKWKGAKEIYILKDKNSGTELIVETDADEEYLDYFENTFPKALDKIKESVEK